MYFDRDMSSIEAYMTKEELDKIEELQIKFDIAKKELRRIDSEIDAIYFNAVTRREEWEEDEEKDDSFFMDTFRKYAKVDDNAYIGKTQHLWHVHARDYNHHDKTRDFWQKRREMERRVNKRHSAKTTNTNITTDNDADDWKPGKHAYGYVVTVEYFELL